MMTTWRRSDPWRDCPDTVDVSVSLILPSHLRGTAVSVGHVPRTLSWEDCQIGLALPVLANDGGCYPSRSGTVDEG